MLLKKKEIYKILLAFIFLHLIIWTLVPSLSNNNLPLDIIEALAWGNNLDWGYNKHPPFSAWSVEFFYNIFGNNDWAYYFLSQLFVVSTFLIIFKFSEDFFKNKILALISVFLLEGIYFYNFTTPEFNVNVCELPFWALSVYYCWKALEKNKLTDWLLFGLFAAFGVLSKYLFIYLLISIDVFFLYLIKKKKFKYKSLTSLVTFLLLLLPHIFWLQENDFITFSYALERTTSESANFFYSHLLNPFIFLGKQIGILVPFFILLFALLSKFKTKFNLKDKKLLFLLTINFVPLILIFLTSVFMGVKIRTMWMTPFYLFFGVLFVYLFKDKIRLNKINNFVSIFIVLFIFSPSAYLFISLTEKNKRTDYPGGMISKTVQEEWDKHYKIDDSSIPIGYVTPDEWHAGNLSYHLRDRPKLSSMEKFEKIDNFFLSFVEISAAPILCKNDEKTRNLVSKKLHSNLQSNIKLSGFIEKKIDNLYTCLVLIIYEK